MRYSIGVRPVRYFPLEGANVLKEQGKNADCAIVLTVHNDIEIFALPCLNSLLKHSGGAKVFVYDNQSTDPKVDHLKSLADGRPEVEFIRVDDQEAFGGLTGTWNDGIRRAREQNFSKVILLNHDVMVSHNWGRFIQAIESDSCVYGPLTNPSGGSNQAGNRQMAGIPTFKGLHKVNRLMGFCIGFTLGKPELKLFDEWRFFNPENPLGGDGVDLQDRMEQRSAKSAFYIVTDSWVFHHTDLGVNGSARYANAPTTTDRNDLSARGETPEPLNYVSRFDDNNIFHILVKEVLPFSAVKNSSISSSNLYLIEDCIDKNNICQKWRYYILSNIFNRCEYINSIDILNIKNPLMIQNYIDFNHFDFIDYHINQKYINLLNIFNKISGAVAYDEGYILLNQRPVGNRYLIDNHSGLPLEEYLRVALGERGTPFKSCDFSTMTPEDQAQVCRGAKLFISAHGAGISNIIFTPPHCSVIEYNFRKHWTCFPVCDRHFDGSLADHEECGSEMANPPYFHKADFHNLSHLLGRPYTELEVDRYEGYKSRNPISREYLYVDGEELLSEIDRNLEVSNSREEFGSNSPYPLPDRDFIGEPINKLQSFWYFMKTKKRVFRNWASVRFS